MCTMSLCGGAYQMKNLIFLKSLMFQNNWKEILRYAQYDKIIYPLMD